MIHRERVGGCSCPLALSVAVQQGAETTFAVIDPAGLVIAISQIPPRHLGVRVIGVSRQVVEKNLGGALKKLLPGFEDFARLGIVIDVLAPLELIIAAIILQSRIRRRGAGDLCRHRAGQENKEGERAFQISWSVGRSGVVTLRRVRDVVLRTKCSRFRPSGRCR